MERLPLASSNSKSFQYVLNIHTLNVHEQEEMVINNYTRINRINPSVIFVIFSFLSPRLPSRRSIDNPLLNRLYGKLYGKRATTR